MTTSVSYWFISHLLCYHNKSFFPEHLDVSLVDPIAIFFQSIYIAIKFGWKVSHFFCSAWIQCWQLYQWTEAAIPSALRHPWYHSLLVSKLKMLRSLLFFGLLPVLWRCLLPSRTPRLHGALHLIALPIHWKGNCFLNAADVAETRLE